MRRVTLRANEKCGGETGTGRAVIEECGRGGAFGSSAAQSPENPKTKPPSVIAHDDQHPSVSVSHRQLRRPGARFGDRGDGLRRRSGSRTHTRSFGGEGLEPNRHPGHPSSRRSHSRRAGREGEIPQREGVGSGQGRGANPFPRSPGEGRGHGPSRFPPSESHRNPRPHARSYRLSFRERRSRLLRRHAVLPRLRARVRDAPCGHVELAGQACRPSRRDPNLLRPRIHPGEWPVRHHHRTRQSDSQGSNRGDCEVARRASSRPCRQISQPSLPPIRFYVWRSRRFRPRSAWGARSLRRCSGSSARARTAFKGFRSSWPKISRRFCMSDS